VTDMEKKYNCYKCHDKGWYVDVGQGYGPPDDTRYFCSCKAGIDLQKSGKDPNNDRKCCGL